MPHDGHVCVKCAGELYIGSARGDVHIDYVFLQPGKWGRFGDGPFLKSGVQTLLDMGVTVIRLGGGFAYVLCALALSSVWSMECS